MRPTSLARVMVIAASWSVATDLARALQREHPQLQTAVWDAQGLHLPASAPPHVVVLALPRAEMALACLADLYGGERTPQRSHQRVLLLAHKDEIAQAHELCRRQVVDDYAQHWPMPMDGYRLRTSVQNLVRTLPAEVGAGMRHAPSTPGTTALPLLTVPSDPAESNAGRTPVRRVLLVDDDPFQHKLLARMLADLPVGLDWVASGQQALAHLSARLPDLVLLDIQMPDEDGPTLLRQWQANPRLGRVPVVMVSGHSDRPRVVTCLSLGAKGFMVKPLSRDTLFETLRKYLPDAFPAAAPPSASATAGAPE